MHTRVRQARKRARISLRWLCLLLVAAPGTADGQRVQPPCRTAVVTGTHVSYCVHGSGQPVFILNAGARLSSGTWGPLVQELAGHGTVVTFDRPGLGVSTAKEGDRTPTVIGSEILALALGVAPPPYVFVGHSAGGYHVLRAIEESPEMARGVVLLDSPHPTFEVGRRALLQEAERFELDSLRAAARATWTASDVAEMEGIESEAPIEFRIDPDLRLLVITGDQQEFGPWGDERRIRDLWAASQEEWSALSSRARSVTVEGGSHMLHYYRAAEVAEEIRRFFPPAPKTVAITIDDVPVVSVGPGARAPELVTERLMSTLRERGVPAIGFVNEIQLSEGRLGLVRGRALLERWVEEGHLLGNHTYSHMWLYDSGAEPFIEDIHRGERVWRPLVEGTPGFRPYLRHPRLNTGRTMEDRMRVERHLDSIGYVVAPVSIDNNEYLFASAYARTLERGDSVLAARIGKEYVAYMDSIVGYFEGQSQQIVGRQLAQILLLHANRLNADYMGDVLDSLIARGYDFITIVDALKDEAYSRADGFVGRQGITWLHRWAISEELPASIFAGEPPVPQWVLDAGNRDG